MSENKILFAYKIMLTCQEVNFKSTEFQGILEKDIAGDMGGACYPTSQSIVAWP